MNKISKYNNSLNKMLSKNAINAVLYFDSLKFSLSNILNLII